MNKFLKHLLQDSLPLSLFPYLVFNFCSLAEAILMNFEDQQNSLSSIALIFTNLKYLSLLPYQTFWSFLATMFFLHLILNLFSQAYHSILFKSPEKISKDSILSPQSHSGSVMGDLSKKARSLFQLTSYIFISCSMIFCVGKGIVRLSSVIDSQQQYENQVIITHDAFENKIFTIQESFQTRQDNRILEEKISHNFSNPFGLPSLFDSSSNVNDNNDDHHDDDDDDDDQDQDDDPHNPGKRNNKRRISLPKTSTFAEVLAFFHVPVFSLVFSQKNNLLYASLQDFTLQIFNVSDPAKPFFLRSIDSFHGYLVLSPDEKVLYNYDGKTLGICQISQTLILSLAKP